MRKWLRVLIFLLVFAMIGSGCGKKKEEKPKPKEEPKVTQGNAESTPGKPKERKVTDEQIKEAMAQMENAKQLLKQFEEEYGYTEVTSENIDQVIDDAMEFLNKNDIKGIKKVERQDNTVRITLDSGVVYVYQPKIKGMKAGGADMKISTYQPFYSDWAPFGWEKADDCAEQVEGRFEDYTFDMNYDETDCTVENFMNIQACKLVYWDGHGFYDDSIGSCLVTGDVIDETFMKNHAYELFDNTIFVSNFEDSTGKQFVCACITPDYIRNSFPEDALENCVLYLGACDSGKDSRLADAFISRGAMAVYGNTETVSADYDCSMVSAITDALTNTMDDGSYYSFEDALEYAQGVNGTEDPYEPHSQTVLFYKNGISGQTLEWYLDPPEKTEPADPAVDSSSLDPSVTANSPSGDPGRGIDIFFGIVILILAIIGMILVLRSQAKKKAAVPVQSYGPGPGQPMNNTPQAYAYNTGRPQTDVFAGSRNPGSVNINAPPPPAVTSTGGIYFQNGEFAGRCYGLPPGTSCSIGRSPDNQIVIDRPEISRQHCTITFRPDGIYELLDLSSNGIFIQNQRVPKNVRITIQRGTQVTFGISNQSFILQ